MEPHSSDQDLMGLALHGESEAFGEIFRRHADRVYHHCFRRLGSWSAAEDATSLVFLETWRRRSDARFADGSLLPWLLGVANNVARNVSRAARRYHSALFRMSAQPGLTPDYADDVADRVDDERRIAPILRELRRLPRREQDVVALVLMSGLTYAEAAVALGVPVGTVRSRLSRARKRMSLPTDDRRAVPRLTPGES